MEVVMGRPIKQRPMKLCDVDMQSGRVVIWGDIFSVESRETRDGESVIITVMLTDLTSSNILKIIAKKKEFPSAIFRLTAQTPLHSLFSLLFLNIQIQLQSTATPCIRANGQKARILSYLISLKKIERSMILMFLL